MGKPPIKPKTMKKIWITLALCTVAALAISCDPAPKTRIIEGTVVDATMNNVMLVTAEGDTVNVSTMDADPALVQGVLLGEQVNAVCVTEKVGENEVLKAIELTVTQHVPAFYIAGKWVEPNPIDPASVQGVQLNQDGTAASVGMATLLFSAWKLDGDNLLLQSQSIGSGGVFEDTETLRIVKIDADSLVLARSAGDLWRLSRAK